MNKKAIISFIIIGILFVLGGISKKFINKGRDITECIESAENVERTNEEYISIFLDNKEDFEYVADMMNQWPERSSIHFESGILSKNQEIADEIENNEEFYEHLKNLYDLKEIYFVMVEGNKIVFYFSKPPKDYIGGFIYWENTKDRDLSWAVIIDEHWTMEILPAV